ncbi:MAG: translation elongation factor Ts [Vigna little leaf phytoplasma]|nr:translation elongation factor Ts [Vigna little leaf phytoplasma]
MPITIEIIKIVREKTKAGMLHCKKALEKTNGNIEQAIQLLTKENINKTIQNDKIPSEGLTNVFICNNKAFLFELNTETDFVAKNDLFLQLYNKLSEILSKTDDSVQNINDFLNFKIENKNVQELISETSAILKEKIILNRLKIVKKNPQESFGYYKHQGGKISALVVLSKACPEVEMNLPVHIVGFNPKFISKEQVDPEFLTLQKELLFNKTRQETKNKKSLSEKMINQIVNQRLDKMLENICLLEQKLYCNLEQTVKEYLNQYKIEIRSFYRFELGEKN